MRRALVAIAVMSPMLAAAYACSTDTFVGDGGADSSVESGVTQADFCAAETLYYHQCGADDAACVQADLKTCGALFADFSSGFANALTRCMQQGKLPCTSDFTQLATSSCVSDQVLASANQSSKLAALAADFCNACDKDSGNCVGKFASANNQPGYIPSLFNDNIIQQMDDCEKKLDGGTIVAGDASISCLQQTLICEYIAIGAAGPASACNDQ